MASLENIKTRISSVSVFEKITKAMELVSISKFRRIQEELNKVREYTDRVENVFLNINKNIKSWENIIHFDPEKPRIFVLISSDFGLCGGYNSNIIKLAKKTIKKDDFIIPIGTKGTKWANEYFDKKQIILDFPGFGDIVEEDKLDKITSKLVEYLLENKARGIHVLYTRFINSLRCDPEDKKIFPFSRTERLKMLEENPITSITEFEPNSSTVLLNSLPLYINSILLVKFVNSKTSEMSSRRIAMENSTNNAKDIIENLKKDYNKIRQAKITQEIAEIVAGADNE
ncbi:MAG: ATP synthase F1 subunit gamma [Metamycoplasmataceae bacterium]